MTDTTNPSSTRLDAYIARARATAATGRMTYAEALDEIAVERRYQDWRTFEGMLREGRSHTGRSAPAHLFDHVVISILDTDPRARRHRLDRIIRNIFRLVLEPVARMGVPTHALATIIAALAVLCTIGCGPLAYLEWHDDRSFMMEGSIVSCIALSTAFMLWLGSRWTIHHGEPLHRACHDLRNCAGAAAFFSTIFGLVVISTVRSWTTPNMVETMIGAMAAAGPVLWMLAIHMDAFHAGRSDAA